MSGEASIRRLLPQNTQLQNYAFVPPYTPRDNQKNYVFVDEQNRHKRLKVMRACEGCRRRKIKCDAATTNTWPCTACIRLKLHCIPPMASFEHDQQSDELENDLDRPRYFTADGVEGSDRIQQQHSLTNSQLPIPNTFSSGVQYGEGPDIYQSMSYQREVVDYPSIHYDQMQPAPSLLAHTYGPSTAYSQDLPLASVSQMRGLDSQDFTNGQPPQHLQLQTPSHSDSADAQYQETYQQQDLADLLGDLKITSVGTAPYLDSKLRAKRVEEPIMEDVESYQYVLPSITAGPDMRLRIPPELMPDDATCLQYFEHFFTNVHPYVPVLSKAAFYQQWQTDRSSMSPLVLEAIFAIGSRLADEPSQGQQWLALAGKHADSFMVIPRLSTLQGMIILLKARESAPKRGYYYRSWLTVVQCVSMAKDLGLEEHFEEHNSGKGCEDTQADCVTKTRIWQTLFVLELIIGSPQGRTDFGVDLDTLDLTIQRPVAGDTAEFHVTRNFNYLTRMVKNVREMRGLLQSLMGKKKDWALDPEVIKMNPIFVSWMTDLPSDLRITFPDDGSPPWLPSHFIGNLHSYYYLSIIMLHRPQLHGVEQSALSGAWKQHMLVAYDAAKHLCRCQEGILQYFGLTGLLCMQRGVNFTIYAILTCVLLHLVALTSPDPDINDGARGFFERHMRILEKCTGSWPQPDMQTQIDALREAFSADTSRPFQLKQSFPYGSPGAPVQRKPARSHPVGMSNDAQYSHLPQTYGPQPISPPMTAASASIPETRDNSPATTSVVLMPSGQRIQPSIANTSAPMSEGSAWNPSRLFDQWNTTFGAPPTQQPEPPVMSYDDVATSNDMPFLTEMQGTTTLPMSSITQLPLSYIRPPIPSFVSPSMWQESVASVYEGGLKRSWQYDTVDAPMTKRTR